MTELATPLLGERFQVRRCLGAGGFGTVYEAFDAKRCSVVAIKVLRQREAGELLGFKREFRNMCGLTHRNLVTLYELHSYGEEWFFSMELAQGTDFLRYVRGVVSALEPGWQVTPDGPPSPPLRTIVSGRELDADSAAPERDLAAAGAAPVLPGRLLRSLLQLTEGLGALHDSGVVHRDIKPSNVVCTWEGRLVLLDFGLALLPAEQPVAAGISGTPDYMAPEQALGQAATPASDLYAVGVLLYEALSGQLPFSGTPQQVLRQKIAHAPAPLPTATPAVPAALRSLCLQLLQREPERRPSLAALQAELRALEPSGEAKRSADGNRAAPPRKQPFVGRERELAVLRQALRESRGGAPAVVSCSGDSGVGKSALCRHFLRELAAHEPQAVVLAGSCYEHEDVPFKALDGVVDTLSQFLRRLPARELAALIPPDAPFLARLFPVLRQVPAIETAEAPPLLHEVLVRQAACEALRELLRRLSARGPLVLCIDDLQWGDLDGTALLLELLRPPRPPALLLLLTHRAGEEQSSAALGRLLPGLRRELGRGVGQYHLAVRELSADDSHALARALLPAASERYLAAITAEAGGNALFIAELSRATPDPQSPLETEAAALAPAGLSSELRRSGLDELIRRRVERLPAASRQLLLSVAISGQPVARSASRRATYGEQPETDEPQALAELRAERLIRVRLAQAPRPGGEPREELLPYHDRVREAVLAKLPAAERVAQHLRLARALESWGHAEPEQLVFHLQQGGEPGGAARYAVQASAQAYQALAYHQAARLCQAALASGCLGGQEAHQVRVRMADALVGSGRPKEASETLLGLAEGASAEPALRWRQQAARQLFIGGYVEEGHRVLRGLLRAARLRLPRSQLGLLGHLLFYRLLLRLRGYRFTPRAESELPARVLLRIDTCEAIGASSTVTPLLGSYFWLRCLGYALRAGEPRRISIALSTEAMMLFMFGGARRRVKRVLHEALAIAVRSEDAYAEGRSICTAGYLAQQEGSWRESAATLRRAVELLKGQAREATLVIDFIGIMQLNNLRWLGELQKISEEFPPYLADARERGRQSQELLAQLTAGFLLPLCDDDPEAAEEIVAAAEQRIAGQSFNSQHLVALEVRLLILLYRGQGSRAWELYLQSKRALARADSLRVEFYRVLWCHLRAVVALSGGQPVRLAEEEARRLARSKVRFAAPLRELILALVHWRQGRTADALSSMSRAEAGFVECEMSLHVACVRLRRGAWLGGREGAALGAAAQSFMTEQGIRRADRMAALFLPPD